MSDAFNTYRVEQQRLRVVAFALLTPFFFLKAGMSVSVSAMAANLGTIALLFGVKFIAKLVGVYPFARRYLHGDAWFTTLLMSTGLTFGTISSTYGLNAGLITADQFTVLLTVVIATAILPTLVAQRFFQPDAANANVDAPADVAPAPLSEGGG